MFSLTLHHIGYGFWEAREKAEIQCLDENLLLFKQLPSEKLFLG